MSVPAPEVRAVAPRDGTTPGPAPVPLPDLDALTAPPATKAATADGFGVQDIPISLPGDRGADPLPEVVLTFDTVRADLPAAVAEALDTAYVLAGIPGKRTFEAALKGTSQQPPVGWLGAVSRGLPVKTSGGRVLRGDPYALYLDEDRTPRRHRLVEALGPAVEDLATRRATAERIVATAARDAALGRLAASRAQVRREAFRHLAVADEKAAASVLDGSSRPDLRRDELEELLRDLVAIADAREKLAGALSTQQQVEDRGRRPAPGVGGPRRPGLLGIPDRAARDDLRARTHAQQKALDAAEAQVADKRRVLAELVAHLGRSRPVLFAWWEGELPGKARALAAGRASPETAEAIRTALLTTLRDTWAAAGELTRTLADEDAVWRFPALVERTIEELGVDAEVPARVARDRVTDEEAGSDLQELSDWIGHVELAASVATLLPGAQPAAGVAALAAVAGLVVDAATVVVKGLRLAEEDRAARAFLVPSERLAASPSYSSLMVDVALVGLSVLLSVDEFRTVARGAGSLVSP
ncbi:hypothetical protein [Actinomycetospora flava]|uniref:Uncharacterized protein n=1 Tax=Actinomycetospora flava TaxID=3129232 RepID=A0ABU8M7B6_9PSEU